MDAFLRQRAEEWTAIEALGIKFEYIDESRSLFEDLAAFHTSERWTLDVMRAAAADAVGVRKCEELKAAVAMGRAGHAAAVTERHERFEAEFLLDTEITACRAVTGLLFGMVTRDVDKSKGKAPRGVANELQRWCARRDALKALGATFEASELPPLFGEDVFSHSTESQRVRDAVSRLHHLVSAECENTFLASVYTSLLTYQKLPRA